MLDTAAYIKQAISFSKSLVIKFKDVAIAMNNGLLIEGYSIPKSPREWKYYLNLTGQRHPSNQDVKLIVLETGKEETLSKELLDDYPYTRKKLSEMGDMYNNLIETYPNEDYFIMGCVFPTDMDTVIAADDGTILNYRKDYVGSNEYNLIKEVELFIKGFLSRWHNRSYTLTDELYLPAMLSVLYANIPAVIINSKLDKIQTPEVDEFHLEQFFRSNLRLWDELSLLNKPSIFWLYNNMAWVRRNIGKEGTLKTIIDKLLEPNAIGLGEYIIKQADNELKADASLSEIAFNKKEAITLTKSLNNSYKMSEDQEKSIERVVLLELNAVETSDDLDNLTTQNNYLIDQVKTEINDRYLDNQRTKMLDVGVGILAKRYSFDLFKVVLDHWCFLVKNNIREDGGSINKEPTIDFTDPNTSKNYPVSPKVGLLMLVKLMLSMTNNLNVKIHDLTFTYTLPINNTMFDKAFGKMYDDGYLEYYIQEFKDNLPVPLPYFNQTELVKEYIGEVTNYYSFVWSKDCNSESVATSSLIKQLFNYTLRQDKWVVSEKGETIDEILERHGVIYELTEDYDYRVGIENIILTFTGVYVDEYFYIKEMLNHTKSLINKLTSYTVQVLTDSKNEKSNPAFYNNIEAFKVRKGLIGEVEGELDPLQRNHVDIKAQGVNFEEQAKLIYIHEDEMQSAFCRKAIDGTMDIVKGPLRLTYPQYDVEMLQPFVMDTRNCPHEDKFLLKVNAEWNPLESPIGTMKGGGSDRMEGKRFQVNELNAGTKVYLDNQGQVEGQMELIEPPEIAVSFLN